MRNATLRRSVALVAAAAILASLAAATVAAPTTAGTPKCFGKPATIVGTAGGEVILGTNGPDVIVARGGHDKIYGKGGNDTICGNTGNDRIYGGLGSDLVMGQLGNDELFGNAGLDRLLGGPGDDSLNGGIDVDLCVQGTGSGPQVNCERPAPPGPPPAIDLTDVLAIAYTDLNKNHKPDSGDVMIARLVDKNDNGTPDAGDTVEMGMYPTAIKPVWPTDFEPWGTKSHIIEDSCCGSEDWVDVYFDPTTSTGSARFSKESSLVKAVNGSAGEMFQEWDYTSYRWYSLIVDQADTRRDAIDTHKLSPSSPASSIEEAAAGTGDDYLIDVEIYLDLKPV